MNGFYWESDWKGRLVLPDWQMHDRYWVWQTREKLIEAGAVEALPRRGRDQQGQHHRALVIVSSSSLLSMRRYLGSCPDNSSVREIIKGTPSPRRSMM